MVIAPAIACLTVNAQAIRTESAERLLHALL